jgi:hypothetical protein
MLFGSEEEFVEFMDLENPKMLDPVEPLAEALKANMKLRSNRWQGGPVQHHDLLAA